MNVLTIAGNIGKDAEVRTTQNGKDVAGFSVAVSNGKDRDATWFDCSVWGERARKLAPYIRKGDKITVTGSISAEEHNGKAYLKVFVRDLTFQGGKPADNQGGGYGNSQQDNTGAGAGGGGFGSGSDLDDSIPFAPEGRI